MTPESGNVPLIAHVIFRLDVGGLENGVVNLINHMPRDRYRHAIICLTEHAKFRERLAEEIPLYSLRKRDGKDLRVYLRLWRLLRRLKPDIVHTRNLTTVDMVVPAALAGIPHRVHGEHGWDMVDLHGANRKYRWLRRLCRPLVSRYVTVSGHLADWLHESIGVPRANIRHICNGVDAQRFRPVAKSRAVFRDASFAPEGTVVIGTVGRLVEVKDQLSLVRAFLLLRNRVPDGRTRLRLVIIGDGPLRGVLQEALDSGGARGESWLPGQRDDVDTLLGNMDVFVLPSLNEGISNTILEAMASGVPVVATDTGGNPELVEPGRTGCLVAVSAPETLASAIEQYVECPDLAARHGAQGRRRVEREFSLDRMTADYLAVYDELMAGHTPRRQLLN